MILTKFLIDAKDTCFEKIAQNAQEKNLVCVHFKSIANTKYLQIIISNGNDYARLIYDDFEQQVDFKISWETFKQICSLFAEYEKLDIKIKNNQILFFNDKCQYTTPESTLFIKNHNFNFDFTDAYLVSMDDCNIMKEHLTFAKFVINKDNLISSDGNAIILNKLSADFKNNIFQFLNPFPPGTWYFSPKQKIIVRHDKRISYSYKYATGSYPLDAVYSVLNQHFNNHFECDTKDFQTALKQCLKISDKITILFEKNNISLMTANDKNQAVNIEVAATYLNQPKRIKISILDKYALLLNMGQILGKIKILFNDDDNNYALMVKNPIKTVLIMGCR